MPGHSLLRRLRSWRHAFWFAVSERVRWSRGLYREKPVGWLDPATDQAPRIAALKRRYHVQFEQHLASRSSAINYEYLDLLDCAWREWGRSAPQGGVVCDVGCASFSYAAAMHAFFQPEQLIGVEIEGHRLFRDGRARIDYAAGYVAELPGTTFVVADYAAYGLPADLISAWFPFVTADAILAWRLPLGLLKPEALFTRIRHNLKAGGLFVMINHGEEEAELAAGYCVAAGLMPAGRHLSSSPLGSYRLEPPVVSLWGRA